MDQKDKHIWGRLSPAGCAQKSKIAFLSGPHERLVFRSHSVTE